MPACDHRAQPGKFRAHGVAQIEAGKAVAQETLCDQHLQRLQLPGPRPRRFPRRPPRAPCARPVPAGRRAATAAPDLDPHTKQPCARPSAFWKQSIVRARRPHSRGLVVRQRLRLRLLNHESVLIENLHDIAIVSSASRGRAAPPGSAPACCSRSPPAPRPPSNPPGRTPSSASGIGARGLDPSVPTLS